MVNRFVDNIENIRAEVFIIGYSEEGESQIVLIRSNDSNEVLFSCVIDSFEVHGQNQTINILQEELIFNLDLVIWTHTDQDHSIGIDNIIFNHCNANTNFFLPEFISGSDDDIINYNDRVKATLDLINTTNKKRNYTVNTASVPVGGSQQLKKIIFKDKGNGKEIDFEIIALSPLSPILRRRRESGVARLKNEFSIATVFKIGSINLLFTSDIENQTIQLIPSYFFENIAQLKTPHHTSLSSDRLIDVAFSEDEDFVKIPLAVTTTYRRNNLPNQDLVAKYKKYTDKFISTGDGDKGYGVLFTAFDVYRNELVEEVFYGDALEL